MVFSNPTFLFAFLPIVLLGVAVLPIRLRKAWLLIASVVFYIWGAGGEVAVILLVGILSFVGALLSWRASSLPAVRARLRGTHVNRGPGDHRPATIAWLTTGRRPNGSISVFTLIGLLLLPILIFKYLPSLSEMAGSLGFKLAPTPDLALPLGISFFTFHAISYVVDVTRRGLPAERSIRDYMLYLFIFPHQIAGPIVRYSEIRPELMNPREIMADQVARGLTRFSWGLAKKACIADYAGTIADAAYSSSAQGMSSTTAWIGALAYAIQIYFDFSGYSDMAIGLAQMLGFDFPENFTSPYRSVGPADFWRRWHMTLSRWFRDYVYIPLGGNRYGVRREYAALLATFLLTSLWHGATWPFLIWGGLHSLALTVERLTGLREATRMIALRRALMVIFVIVSWVPFRATSLTETMTIWQAMFSFDFSAMSPELTLKLTPSALVALAIGTAVFLGPRDRTGYRLVFYGAGRFRYPLAAVAIPVLLVAAIATIMWLSFSPFLYFQF